MPSFFSVTYFIRCVCFSPVHFRYVIAKRETVSQGFFFSEREFRKGSKDTGKFISSSTLVHVC